MGKLLDAVRAKNGNTLDPAVEKLVTGIEEAFTELISTEVKGSEERNAKAMSDAITKVIGNLPQEEGKEAVTLTDQLRSMAEKMDKIESQSKRKLNNEERFNLRKKLEQNKEAILEAIRSPSPKEVDINFSAMRAPQVMTTQNVVTGVDVSSALNAVMDSEISYIRYPQNFVLDIIRNRQVSRVPEARIKREQTSREGQAVVVPEGGLKPLVSYTFEDKIYRRQKIAAHMEWTEEFEMDFESLFNAIIDLFERDLLLDWQNILLQTIISTAPAYVSTSLDGTIPFPNIYTAIGAGILSIQNMEFNPNVIWMNQADVWAMNLSQDSTGQVIIPPIMVGNNQIAGLRLYSSSRIDQGYALIGESDTWREEHTDFISRIGLINEQLIHNEKTIVGEVFSLMYQSVRDQGSWIYLDISAVMAALQRPAA